MPARRQLFRVAPIEDADGVRTTFTLPHPFYAAADVVPFVDRPKSVPLITGSPTPGAGEYYADPATSTVEFGTAPESLYFRMLTTDLTVHSWVPRLDVALEGDVDGSNTTFYLPELPADYDQIEILVGKPGAGLDLVVSNPTDSEFTIAGQVIEVGLAPYAEEGPPRASYFYEDQRASYENTTGLPIPASSGAANPRYAKFAATALRMLDRFGGDFILIRKTLASYDPAAGVPGYNVSTVAFRGVLLTDSKGYRFQDGGQDAARVVITPALSVLPKIGDQVDVGGNVMNVNSVDAIQPDGVSAIVYRLGVAA